MPNPQLGRTELHDLNEGRIPDNPLNAIEPKAVREVIDNIIDSTVNRADDGASGPGSGTPAPGVREYVPILANHWAPADPPTSLITLPQALDYLHGLAGNGYTPLLPAELNANKSDYARLALRPLLIKIINALGSTTPSGTINVGGTIGTPGILVHRTTVY